MSYVAEPYAQFVDDLLTALTGGVVRERFVFVSDEGTYQLAPPGPVVKSTLQVYGQSNSEFTRFRLDRDYVLAPDNTIVWRATAAGAPAADAVWPDEGTPFFANYDHLGPPGPAPQLTDRNPGSVVRLISESFAREFATMSRQLEAVYDAAFLDTAEGRDLDQLVRLVGLSRADRSFAGGTVIFGRSTPAAADVTIPAGSKLSTAEPPAATFETTEDRTLQRGSLTVEAPIRAITSGPVGVVAARAITVIHRPIFGLEFAFNSQPTQFSGEEETDEALRARARRALEGSGKATPGALLAALATIPGVREKDIRIDEDHLVRPGVIVLNVAAALSGENCVRALNLITATRPAGVRVLHNLDCTTALGSAVPGDNPVELGEDTPAEATAVTAPLYFPVVAAVVLTPAGEDLTPQQRASLKRTGEDTVRAFIDAAGIGETLIYNQLVARLVTLDGVLDVTVELYPAGHVPPKPTARNVTPPRTLRPSIAREYGGALTVQVGGQLIAVDVVVGITLEGAAAVLGDVAANLEDARIQVAADLAEKIGSLGELSVATLRSTITETENFTIGSLTFGIEYLEAGVRVNKQFSETDAGIPVGSLERPWVRSVKLAGAS